jgi:D-arabinose 1-dehydrogenase-like Zn-dependent alcohol dehydrogenase
MDLPAWLLSDVAVLPVNTISRAAAVSRCDPELRAMLEDGRLTLSLEKFPLTDIGDAVTRLRSGVVRGRAVLTMPSHSAER